MDSYWRYALIWLMLATLFSVTRSASVATATTGDDDIEDDAGVDNMQSNAEIDIDTEQKAAGFTVYDYVAVCAMLVISIGIGVFYGWFGKKKGSDTEGGGADSSGGDFLLGSGMSLFPVTLSLTTSFITAIELLGNPSEMFFNGTQFSLIVISMVLVVPVAVKVFYPIYYKLDVTSCYEYLGMRFDKRIRVFGAILYILQMLFYTSVAVLAPAIALSEATGLDRYIAVVLIYFVCIFYSSQGGMKAVVIADTFQAVVLLVSLVLILILGTHYSAGLSDVFSRASDQGRIEFFNFDPNPTTRHSVWSVIIGGFFYWTSMFCTNQASVQKCMSLKSLKTAKHALYLALLGLIVVFLMNFYTGLMTFAHYSECDPLAAGQITAKDQLLPFYVMDVFGHIKFMTGIFVAGIFAASLGTVAAALNSLAAVTSEDLLVSGMEWKIPQGKGALYAKWMSLGFGLVSFGLVFVVERLGGILQATLTLNGLIGGVTLGLFSLGIFFRRANSKGALYGGVTALLLVIVVGVLAQLNNEDPAPLPSSVAGCNATIFGDLGNHPAMTYALHPGDGSSLALALSLEDDATGTGDGEQQFWNSEAHDGSFYSFHRQARDVDSTDSSDDSSWFSSVLRISYMWYSCLGALLTMLFGIIVSLIFGEEPLTCCSGRAQPESPLPSTNGNGRISTVSGSVVESNGVAEKRPSGKLNVGSMAPLALMMRTSVKFNPSAAASDAPTKPYRSESRESFANAASLSSSVASILSIDQQTVSSELGSYTEPEENGTVVDQRKGTDSTGGAPHQPTGNGNQLVTILARSVAAKESERF
ncbi:sodium-coupled monocarboxylate transporter 1 [Anopheles aquasalis]|uniref:sodium-coupled monocarboxylate transporter 1 n=1 Tax=Anopheles aquasalis TaxID=42839 RepID=UPI00215AA7D1|nr:sodium-coupled monocarboxylate transporter 1 [Anopheles aquasalis]XP_050094717.1 sodium-coupled monocarboxylate transporter 1 [Anopheles aquasalis]XP_050094718.1 sodium-coupled monocarboxylate transporter 1 [Anopheles aquasalis]